MQVFLAYVEDLSNLGGPMGSESTRTKRSMTFKDRPRAIQWLINQAAKEGLKECTEVKLRKQSTGTKSFFVDPGSYCRFGLTIVDVK